LSFSKRLQSEVRADRFCHHAHCLREAAAVEKPLGVTGGRLAPRACGCFLVAGCSRIVGNPSVTRLWEVSRSCARNLRIGAKSR